ncbi:MAG: hypothetical protein E6G50_12135 [Actinobacteria bacterium]|nr:MAG: hypothetical protein E6G50_12135 [Actinomycetota bacterium]
MAKKVRTPAPPKRPVQAPQRRDTRRARPPADDRRRLWGIIAVLAVIAVAGIGAALYFGLRGGSGSSTPAAVGPNPFNSLPGIRKTKQPWPPEVAHLQDRLAPLNLTSNPTEQLAYHIHQHLDIFVNGKHVTVPQCIGIYGCYQNFAFITELHTHRTDGIVHVEAPSNKHYTLGTFFAEWGVFLSKKCVGAYCQGYKWYVNGKPQTEPPYALKLEPHQEIAIAIGKPPAHIPSTFNWTGL